MSLLLLSVLFAVLAFLETQLAFRRAEEQERQQRWKVNFLAFGASSLVSLGTQSSVIGAAEILQQHVLVSLSDLSPHSFAESSALFGLRICCEILALDLYLYFWHRINHKVGFFWRFHQFHHFDAYLDVTTALRFHPCEIMLSQFFRLVLVSSVILTLGISPISLVLFQSLVTAASMFHHSNIRLSPKIESLLARVIVTPRHHQNHHSWYLEETDSNFGAIFSFWDTIFSTQSRHRSPEEIRIGVPTHSTELLNSLSFSQQLRCSFEPIKRWPVKFLTRGV